jgi:hypothetical protein
MPVGCGVQCRFRVGFDAHSRDDIAHFGNVLGCDLVRDRTCAPSCGFSTGPLGGGADDGGAKLVPSIVGA